MPWPKKGDLVFITKKGMVSLGVEMVYIPDGVEETIRAYMFDDQVYASYSHIPGLPYIDEQTGLLVITNVKILEERRRHKDGSVLQFVTLLHSKLWCLTIEMEGLKPNIEDYISKRPLTNETI